MPPHPTIPNPKFLDKLRPVTKKRFKSLYKELLVWKHRAKFYKSRVSLLRAKLSHVEGTVKTAMDVDDSLERGGNNYIRTRVLTLPTH